MLAANLPDHIKRAQSGDNEAFGAIYESTHKKTFFICLKIMNNENDAYDMLQETYIQAFKSLKDLKDPDAFNSWLSKIAVSKCNAFFRKNSPEFLIEDEYPFEKLPDCVWH